MTSSRLREMLQFSVFTQKLSSESLLIRENHSAFSSFQTILQKQNSFFFFFFVSILSHPTRDSFWQWSCNRIPKRLRDQSLDATSKLRAECSLREFNTTSTTFASQPAHALTDAWQEHDTDGIHSKPALAVCSEQHPPATQTRFFFPVYLSYIFIYMYTYAYFRNGDDT